MQWCYSAMVQQYTTVQWCNSASLKVQVQQCNSNTVCQCNNATEQQYNGAMVQQCNSDTVQQCKGAMVQQYYYISSNVTVQWCNTNTVCQCNNATVSRESFLPEWGFTLIPGVSDLESLAPWCDWESLSWPVTWEWLTSGVTQSNDIGCCFLASIYTGCCFLYLLSHLIHYCT